MRHGFNNYGEKTATQKAKHKQTAYGLREPTRKKMKSINPPYVHTPLQWSFHEAQKATPGGTVKSYLLYTLLFSFSSQMAFQTIILINIPDVCFENLFIEEKNLPLHAKPQFVHIKHCGISAAAHVHTFCSMSSAVW